MQCGLGDDPSGDRTTWVFPLSARPPLTDFTLVGTTEPAVGPAQLVQTVQTRAVIRKPREPRGVRSCVVTSGGGQHPGGLPKFDGCSVRAQRAEIKVELKKGTLSLVSLLERAPSEDLVGKMKVSAVLENLPGYGKVKAHKVMEQVGISDTRRLAGLGANPKSQLLALV